MAKRDPYEDTYEEASEVHPVDRLIDRHLRHESLRRKILSLLRAITKALGPKRLDLLLTLEELLNLRALEREHASFNIGHALGAAVGRAEALRAFGPRASKTHRELVRRVRRFVMLTEAPPSERVAALLEVAWSIAVAERVRERRGARRPHTK